MTPIAPSESGMPPVKVFIAFAVGTLYKALTSPLRPIPGPKSTLLTNLPLKLSVLSGTRCHHIDALHRTHGPIVRISPTEVSVNSLEGFKQIHSLRSGFRKSKWYEEFVRLPKLVSFSMSERREHAARRKLFARAFGKTALRREWEGLVRSKCALAVARMGEESRRVGKVDVLKWWMFLASDVVGEISFGEGFGNLERGEKNAFIGVLEKVTKGSGIRVELPLLGVLGGWIPTEEMQMLWNGKDLIMDYASKAVETARSLGGVKNIFASVIATADEGAQDLTDLDIKVEAVNFIIAGSDTTGMTLTYLTWAVLQRPEIRTALEQEVATLPSDFSDADLEALPFLNATIDETLRLYGAAPGSLPRTAPKGGAQLGDYFIPEGFTVSTQSYSMHRDPKLFPDPERFNPYRWLDTADPLSEEAKSAFASFGAGAHTCIGVHLARMELRIATTLFFREWRGVARLAAETTNESMAMENYFLIAPAAHKCEVVIGKS
ncbi:hypothetical protein BLS_003505 [Venturia inaequalis]|uniref:Cytochrome P450 n=1 Tax=Venturia inaequalis TaxID=5025 RepID=A0A8H3VT44_VENIN|nr:hypothetical protein BLS_003505 [Venturia inaequalis]KAE9993576.1 hypothetical protein EG327_004335 [Venturia inaequalis]